MKNSGFTLVELMIALGMASIVVGVIYSAYTIQTRIYSEQDRLAEMQQNARAGIMLMQKEVRMAGYNPEKIKDTSCNANPSVGPAVEPGIHTATATTFGFSMDLNEDKDCDDSGENITYSIYTSGGISKLGRIDNNNDAAIQPIAQNITNINFVYLFQLPSSSIAAGKAPKSIPLQIDYDEIAAVQVSLLVKGAAPDRKQAGSESFEVPFPDATGSVGSGGPVWSFNDSYRRQLLVTTINCRNMGLN